MNSVISFFFFFLFIPFDVEMNASRCFCDWKRWLGSILLKFLFLSTWIYILGKVSSYFCHVDQKKKSTSVHIIP